MFALSSACSEGRLILTNEIMEPKCTAGKNFLEQHQSLSGVGDKDLVAGAGAGAAVRELLKQKQVAERAGLSTGSSSSDCSDGCQAAAAGTDLT